MLKVISEVQCVCLQFPLFALNSEFLTLDVFTRSMRIIVLFS